MRRKPNTSAKEQRKRLEKADDASEALRLRVDEGLHIRQIAERLGRSVGWVSQEINRLLDETREEDVEAAKRLRELKAQQLDAVIAGSLPKAKAGVATAAQAVIAAVSAQAKLLGLNAKEQLELSGDLAVVAGAHESILEALDRLTVEVAPPAVGDEGSDNPEPDSGASN